MEPRPELLIKLGSGLVHAEELIVSMSTRDANAIAADRAALQTITDDPEVIEWREQMDALAFLPVKRSA